MLKTSFLILCLSLSFSSLGQGADYQISFNHIALSVTDLDASVDFYKNVLQLKEITNRTKMDGIKWLSLSEGKELHLISILKSKITTNKAVHFALTVTNFKAFIKQLQDRNIPYSDWPGTPKKINIRADGIQQIFFQDTDGYWIEVNSAADK